MADTSDTVTTDNGPVQFATGDGQKVTADGNADYAVVGGLAEVVVTARIPKNQCFRVAGEPIGARQGRGNLNGSGIEYCNNKLEHICDASLEVRQRIGANKYTKAIFVRAARAAAKAINSALGADPSGQVAAATNQIKKLNSFLQKTLKVIKKINDFIKLVASTIQFCRAIIEWILSLPERFMQLLKKCLVYLLNLVKSYLKEYIDAAVEGVNEGWKEGYQVASTGINDMKSSITELGTSINSVATGLVGVVVAPEQVAEAVVNPNSSTLSSAADSVYGSYDTMVTTGVTLNTNIGRPDMAP